jgi:hypothetical protein
MNHPLKTLLVCLVLIISTGCADSRQQPQTEGIKIGELAPTGRRVPPQVLRTTNIDVITFELPGDNIKSLDAIWLILNADSLRYNDSTGFAANRLQAAAGESDALDKVTELLKSAKAKKLSTTSLLIPNGQTELFRVARLPRKTTISYIGRQGAIKSAQAGPGIFGLEVSARQSADPSTLLRAGTRPLANVQVVPAILASTEGLVPVLAALLKEADLRFYSAGFSMIMKPGDFVLLTPSEYKADETTAAGRFLTKPEPNPTVRVLLFVCTSIT